MLFRSYQTKTEDGQKAYIYLLDKELGMDTIGKISPNLAEKILTTVVDESYRKTAETISKQTGQRISHGGVWNLTQEVGSRLKKMEAEDLNKVEMGKPEGKLRTSILFQEADGVWINVRAKDRLLKKKKREMKVAIAYDGWEKKGKNRYYVTNKVAVAGFENTTEFNKILEGAINSRYDTSEIKTTIINGDGDPWIRSDCDNKDIHFQLDRFHIHKAITDVLKEKKAKNRIIKYINEGKPYEAIRYIDDLAEECDKWKKRKEIMKLSAYLYNNIDGLIPYQKRGLDIPDPPEGKEYRTLGTMEHNICDIIAQRLKNNKASWSIAGADTMGKLLAARSSGNLNKKIQRAINGWIPERYYEKSTMYITNVHHKNKVGNGYEYPYRGGRLFANGYMTNARKNLIGLTKPGGSEYMKSF